MPFFLIQRFVFPYQLSSLLLGQHFLLTSPEENVTDFWRKRIFGNRLLSTLLQIFDEPWTRPWSCQWSKDNPSMPSWTKLALISENMFWTPKSHGYNQTPGSTASGAATISNPNFRQWLNNGSKVQPSTSGISAVPSNQYLYRASPTHPTGKKHQHRNQSCDECNYITSSPGNISREKFAIHQKRRHSCECEKSITSKCDLNQRISRDHDNCPIVVEI